MISLCMILIALTPFTSDDDERIRLCRDDLKRAMDRQVTFMLKRKEFDGPWEPFKEGSRLYASIHILASDKVVVTDLLVLQKKYKFSVKQENYFFYIERLNQRCATLIIRKQTD